VKSSQSTDSIFQGEVEVYLSPAVHEAWIRRRGKHIIWKGKASKCWKPPCPQ